MFNKTYHARAVRQGGGGHKVAEDMLLRLPWAGIFEPWRPFVAVAAATGNNREKPRNTRRDRLEAAGQARLFPENSHPSKERLSGAPRDFARPLFDLFPEAYE